MYQKILFCTVGGSHQPILTAIDQIRPDFTCFFCTSGAAGSDQQVLGTGAVIKARFSDKKPSLPNIPAQAGLTTDQFTVVNIDPDNLNSSFTIIFSTITDVMQRFKGAELVADYTGGTKGMTVALVLAALETNIRLHLVTGPRRDLIKVVDGTQLGMPVDYESIRLRREMGSQLSAWRQYAYGQASIGLQNIQRPLNTDLQHGLLQARNISRAFEYWDRFDHPQARQLLQCYHAALGKHYAPYYQALHTLTGDKSAREPALIYDLWQNALRRAAQGRYDDAVARVYRTLEWVAQWGLKFLCQVDAADIPKAFIPDDITIFKNRLNKYQAPLYQAWQLIATRTRGPLAAFFQDHGKSLLGQLNLRNNSILAHGFQPVSQTAWASLAQWMAGNFWPYFQQEAKSAGMKHLPPQLPDQYDF